MVIKFLGILKRIHTFIKHYMSVQNPQGQDGFMYQFLPTLFTILIAIILLVSLIWLQIKMGIRLIDVPILFNLECP